MRKWKSAPAAQNFTAFGKTTSDVSGAKLIAWQRVSWAISFSCCHWNVPSSVSSCNDAFSSVDHTISGVAKTYRKTNQTEHDFAVHSDSDQILAKLVAGQLEALNVLIQGDDMAGRRVLRSLHGSGCRLERNCMLYWRLSRIAGFWRVRLIVFSA